MRWLSAMLSSSGKSAAFETVRAAPAASARAQCLIFTGNPGLPQFYSSLARELCDRTGAEVTVVGLAGHLSRAHAATLGAPEGRYEFYPLSAQRAHTTDAARDAADRASAAGVPLVLIGHSIGGWLAIQAALALEAERAGTPALVLGIFAYLQNNRADPAFESTYRLLTLPSILARTIIGVIGAFGSALGVLPKRISRMVLKTRLRTLEPRAIDVVMSMLRWPSIANLIRLARTEVCRMHASHG